MDYIVELEGFSWSDTINGKPLRDNPESLRLPPGVTLLMTGNEQVQAQIVTSL